MIEKVKAFADRYPWRSRAFLYGAVNGIYIWLVENEIVPVVEHWESTLQAGLAVLTMIGFIKSGEAKVTPISNPRLPEPVVRDGFEP